MNYLKLLLEHKLNLLIFLVLILYLYYYMNHMILHMIFREFVSIIFFSIPSPM